MQECNASAGCMEWDVSFIARRDSSESAASECDVAESAVPDTSRDEEVAARLSQEWNGVRTIFNTNAENGAIFSHVSLFRLQSRGTNIKLPRTTNWH